MSPRHRSESHTNRYADEPYIAPHYYHALTYLHTDTTLDLAVATAFPLEVGVTWRYQAHIEEQRMGKVEERDETVTERVLSRAQQAGIIIFALERAGGLNPGRFYCLVRDNRVYVFPLHVGASWGAIGTPMPNHWYEWYVEGQEDEGSPSLSFWP